MSVGQSLRPSAVMPLVLAVLLIALAVVLSALSSLSMWDPGETCEVRGSYSSSEKFLGNPLCADGSAVQPMWMTATSAVALLAAGVCVTVAIIRSARRDDQKTPPPVVSHWS